MVLDRFCRRSGMLFTPASVHTDAFFDKHTCRQEKRPDADCGVGDVETGPVVSVPMSVQKSTNLSVPHPVHEVAHGS